jgi:hypothetical protein
MYTQNNTDARDEDVTDVGETNRVDDIEDADAYDILNFFRRFGEGDSNTTQNDVLGSNSGHIIGASNKLRGMAWDMVRIHMPND